MFLVAARHGRLTELTTLTSTALLFPQFHNPERRIRYDWSRSTEENYKSNADCQHYGNYATIRKTLDYSYHSIYTKERQLIQNHIIDQFLHQKTMMDVPAVGTMCTTSTEPWVVFTAGCMGAGKSWTIRHLSQRGDFPLGAFVTVDPDDIRHHLPEFEFYARLEPERAGELTGKEAGLVSEILTLAALEQGRNVLVDGSLRDASWYESHFQRLKREYARLRIGILHITAKPEAVYARASSRAQQTGRVIPRATLEESRIQVPKSVERLRPLADFYSQLHNAEDAEITIEAPAGLTWKAFREAWTQSCDVGMSERRRLNDESNECLENEGPPK
jgi:Zeta toxin